MTAAKLDPTLCQQLAALITHVAPNGRHPLLQVDLQAVIDQLTAAAELRSRLDDRIQHLAHVGDCKVCGDRAQDLRDVVDADGPSPPKPPALTASYVMGLVVAAVDGGLVYGDRFAGYQCNDGALEGLADTLLAASGSTESATPAQPALTADEVRAVVIEACERFGVHHCGDALAARVSVKLAGRTVDPVQRGSR